MLDITGNIQSILQKIHDYKRYVYLNRRFIQELEQEGGDTDELKKDIAEIEARIVELQMKYGIYR